MGRTLREIADAIGADIVRGDPEATFTRVVPVDDGAPDGLTFVTKSKFLSMLAKTRAGAVMIAPDLLARPETIVPEPVAILRVHDAYVAFARAAQFLGEAAISWPPPGVHPMAYVDPSATIGDGVTIGPMAVVGPEAEIGPRAILYEGAHVGARAVVGAETILYDHVVVRHGCRVGARCTIHAGAVVGADGFGFAPSREASTVAATAPGAATATAAGAATAAATATAGAVVASESAGADLADVEHIKIPQVGTVVIEDDVEVGANTCIDRATLGVTRIGAGTKIDNLVQIAHNVEMGEGCIVVAQAGVAGSTRLGRRTILAAQSGIAGHLEVGAGAVVFAQSGVMTSLAAGAQVLGTPARPKREFFRVVARLTKLEDLVRRVRVLERGLEELKSWARLGCSTSLAPATAEEMDTP
ncbi:MAG: UDP-3-O-(3-hydroxymyristoyl)glucosamine N-acyltransferase [Deltaproteobacteria bacterium]|nr:UDP-3-O-(3-hydroxymyristoyl)glucosamine N-acyltransferase [Deltaproteobacteria bacterium]